MYLQQITEKIIEAITKTIRKESNDKHRFFMQIPFISGLYKRRNPKPSGLSERHCKNLEGTVQVVSDDYWGERQILAGFRKGQLFGEAYACMEKTPLMVSALAVEETQVLMLNAHRVLQTCTSACDFHRRLVENLVAILAKKNLTLTRKIDQVSKKTIRGKVLAYLSSEASQQNSSDITIPFNRQQLAEYLAVDRSALSAELSKMQKEGMIQYKKNHFILNKEIE